MRSRGVYFLANDQVLNLAIAFLNSFRHYNSSLQLSLIPFDSNITRLAELANAYSFDVYANTDLLRRCDEISIRFHGRILGQYRKLAAWEATYDEFLYVDVDTIVLENVNCCFEFLREYDFVTSHSNLPNLLKWVWKPSIFGTGKLSNDQIEFSANTGFIASRRAALTFEEVEARLTSASELAPHMEFMCAEQPLLNYLIVTSGKPYTSLLSIARRTGRRDIPQEFWAGNWFLNIREGRLLRPPDQPRTLLVHWAGEWQRGCHEGNPLWRYYRDMAPSPKPTSR